jgi:hypothetical protein
MTLKPTIAKVVKFLYSTSNRTVDEIAEYCGIRGRESMNPILYDWKTKKILTSTSNRKGLPVWNLESMVRKDLDAGLQDLDETQMFCKCGTLANKRGGRRSCFRTDCEYGSNVIEFVEFKNSDSFLRLSIKSRRSQDDLLNIVFWSLNGRYFQTLYGNPRSEMRKSILIRESNQNGE